MRAKTIARRRNFSDAERAAYRETKRAEARDAIHRAARALLTSDGWRIYVLVALGRAGRRSSRAPALNTLTAVYRGGQMYRTHSKNDLP
jgi:hypothetical protein